MLLSWYYQPYFATRNQTLGLPEVTPFAPSLFDLRGAGFAAWTLAAFAIGALAGMLIRRVVPAIVATLAFYAGLVFAAGGFLRQRYLTPLLTSDPRGLNRRATPAPDDSNPGDLPLPGTNDLPRISAGICGRATAPSANTVQRCRRVEPHAVLKHRLVADRRGMALSAT